MTPEQEAHLESIKQRFVQLTDAKYRKGQAEHGGDLWKKPTLQVIDYAIDEAIDQVTYLLTIRDLVEATEQIAASELRSALYERGEHA